ncbi:MAG: hypothetical protein AB1896_04960 [Thermodesulfobacteriota bacterium]
MHLKGALHAHTTCSDGELSILEAVRVHEALGFDFLALTDHDHLLRPECYDPVYSLNTGLIVFLGRELTVFEKGYCHVNRIEGQNEVLHIFNHPAQLDLPLDKVIGRIQAVAEKMPLDAVEVTNYGFRTPEYETPAIRYPKVATDDSHSRGMCGRAWIELDCPRDKDAILRAVKNGDFWNCYHD